MNYEVTILWNRGFINFQRYFGNIFVTPIIICLIIKNCMTPPSELQCYYKPIGLMQPPLWVVWKICMRGRHWTNFSKIICNHSIITCLFQVDTPVFFTEKKKSVIPALSWPPIWKKMIDQSINIFACSTPPPHNYFQRTCTICNTQSIPWESILNKGNRFSGMHLATCDQ